MSSTKLPEMVGRELSVARELLGASGASVQVVETLPPPDDRHRHALGETWRVIQVRETAGEVTVVAAREIPGPQAPISE